MNASEDTREAIRRTDFIVYRDGTGRRVEGTVPAEEQIVPTANPVELARAWDVTLIGYARGRAFRVYTGAHRVAGLEGEHPNGTNGH